MWPYPKRVKKIQPLNVNFVSKGNENLASWRMRVDTPCRLLNTTSEVKATINENALVSADVNLWAKHFYKEEDQVAISICETEKYFDICDNHFEREHGAHYNFMIARADEITCNTDAMQEAIYEHTGRLAAIIPDPVTFPFGEFLHNEYPKFLWYGNAVNIFSILPYFTKLPNLTVITNATVAAPPHVKIIPWRPGIVEKLIHNYDVVLLPRNADPWALTKSPNRAVDALNAGKVVWSNFPEVYGELNNYILTGDLSSGIMQYKSSPDDMKIKVQQGQKYIKRKYSEEAVLQKWLKALQHN